MIKKILLSCSGLVISFLVMVGRVEASTSLTVNCTSSGSGGCAITPAGTPLIDEGGWFPGSTMSPEPYFAITDNVGVDGYTAVEVTNYIETQNLGSKIVVEIHRDSPSGPAVYGGSIPVAATSPDGLVTFQTWRDDGYFTIDTIGNGQTRTYYVVAYMISNADNSFMGAGVKFDLNFGLEQVAISPDSGGGDGTGNGSDGGGGGSSGGGGGDVSGTTTAVGGSFTAQTGGVLGQADEATPSPAASPEPEVLGETNECGQWQFWVPWILLALQIIFVLVSEYYFRKDEGWTKYYLIVGITLLSIGLFWILKACNCYVTGSWLAWLCRWYWLLAVALTVLLRIFGYTFLENVEKTQDQPKAKFDLEKK